ncbi:spermine synthase-like protein [Tanacetum coccineum]
MRLPRKNLLAKHAIACQNGVAAVSDQGRRKPKEKTNEKTKKVLDGTGKGLDPRFDITKFTKPGKPKEILAKLNELTGFTPDEDIQLFEFIRNTPLGKYDAIIVNSSYHAGPALELIEKPFFEMLARALRPGGVLCNMAESMWLHTHLIQDMINVCCEILKDSIHYAWTSVPTYPSGVIGFILCSTDGPHVHFKIPINQIKKAEGALEHSRELKFYNSHISGEASSVRRALFDIASRLHGFLSKTRHLLGNPSATSVIGRLLG